MSRNRFAVVVGSLVALAVTGTPAQAQYLVGSPTGMKFDLTPTFNTTTAAGQQTLADFERAAGNWAGLFSNNITINLTIGFQNLGNTTTIGQTSALQDHYYYSTVSTALKQDANPLSQDDQSAIAHLQSGNTFKQLINDTANDQAGSGSSTPYLDSTGANATLVDMSNANAKALGLISPSTPGNDATITFNSAFSFDYSPDDGIRANQMDFVGVATHEIGHSLGFISGVDVLDTTSPNKSGAYQPDDYFDDVSTLDLFRYSAASAAQGAIDFTAGLNDGDRYLSFDGGATSIASFATGAVHGDGQQASHWKDNTYFSDGTETPPIGIMDPTFNFGERGVITPTDLRAFDVIGYNLAPVPEPAAWAVFLLGSVGLAVLRVRHRLARG